MISHDPGRRSGFAKWDDVTGRLVAVSKKILYPTVGERVVIEIPTGRGGNTRATVDDLIKLSGRAHRYAGLCDAYRCDVVLRTPNDWKGSTPKPINHERTRKKLTPEELTILAVCGGDMKDILDAVGIGLDDLERRGQRKT